MLVTLDRKGVKKCTFDLSRDACSDAAKTFSELGLRGAQLLEGGCEVLEFVVELLLHLGELLR